MPSYKQVIVLRDDIGMSRGKMIAQACHASLNAYKNASNDAVDAWEREGAKKVTLRAEDLKTLRQRASNEGLPTYMVKDAGLTELEPGTVTALGIGPAESNKIDKITGELDLIS
jgi:PTH2 family peptidyl-tRNA hydrolase